MREPSSLNSSQSSDICFSVCLNDASVTSNHGVVGFLSPVRFPAKEAEWKARRNFTPVLFSYSFQATSPARLDTTVHLWFDWIVRRTSKRPRAMCVLFISCGTCMGPARGRQVLQKSRPSVICDRTRPVRGNYGLHTGCSRAVLICKPVLALRLTMYALKRPVRGGKIRTAPHGAYTGSHKTTNKNNHATITL